MDAVTLCNLALGHIGWSQPIASMDQRSAAAEKCRMYYEPARKRTLRQFDWPFARKYGPLVKADGITPLQPYCVVYAFPPFAVAFRGIEKRKGEDRIGYKLSRHPTNDSQIIHTNKFGARGIWTAAIDNPESDDEGFAYAMSWALATDLAMPLAKDQKKQANCYQMWVQQRSIAEADASNEEPDRIDRFDDDKSPDWIKGRGD